MKVKCIANTEPDEWDPSINREHRLTVGALYEVIGIEADDYRILNDALDPVLFSPGVFEVVDPTRPDHWVTEHDDGVEYSYAPELRRIFEDYHDRKPEAIRTFNLYINRHLRLADSP
jgi:hypothetical protein